jgi:hypothetical protein
MDVKLENVRLAFADLFEAKAFQGDGEPRFGATFVLDPTSPTAKRVASAVEAVAREKWGDDAAKVLAKLETDGRVALMKKPRTDKNGDIYGGFEDSWSVAASTKTRPLVLNTDKTPLVAADGKPYSGCYVYATVNLWAQDNKWGRRINATLMGVQFYRDGDAFVGGRAANPDDFEDLSAPAEDEFA